MQPVAPPTLIWKTVSAFNFAAAGSCDKFSFINLRSGAASSNLRKRAPPIAYQNGPIEFQLYPELSRTPIPPRLPYRERRRRFLFYSGTFINFFSTFSLPTPSPDWATARADIKLKLESSLRRLILHCTKLNSLSEIWWIRRVWMMRFVQGGPFSMGFSLGSS